MSAIAVEPAGPGESVLERDSRKDIDVWLEVHLNCNLRCAFCYNDFQAFSRSEIRGRSLSAADAKAILATVGSVGRLNRVTLAGGELFLHRDWPALVMEAKRAAWECFLVTNGTALSPGTCERIAELAP